MKAAQITGRKQIKIVDVPEPNLTVAGQVKIKNEYLSVCGSDIYLEYDAPLPEEDYPLIPGKPIHECAGAIVESRDPSYKVGDRVIVIPDKASGAAEFVVQTAEHLIRLPNWGNLDDWVMCQHSGTALYSSKYWGNPVGKRIAILGQGGIGLSFTMFAAKQGATQVVGIDLEEYRCEKAMELGATSTVNASDDDITEAAEEITKGKLFDVVVDASGDPNGLNQSIELTRNEGLVIGFSLIRGGYAPLNHQKWMVKNVTIQATVIALTNHPVQEIREMVDLRERGWVDPAVLKTHNMGFSEIEEAYEKYLNRQDKVIKIALNLSS